jgi:hypothetical protein
MKRMATITIPPEIEGPLAEEARLRGTTPELLALDCLRREFVPPKANGPENSAANLAEYLRDFIGVIQSDERVPGGAQMSTESSKKFSRILRERVQNRRQ